MRMKSNLDVISTSIKEFVRSSAMTRLGHRKAELLAILYSKNGRGPYRISGNPLASE
jgi:hypothetical protein